MANNVTININAGTARYNRQLDQAKAKMRETFGHGSVSSIQATSASLRLLEGNMTNNIRAVERFLANTLKLGPALSSAFPVIGAAALGTFLVATAEKLHKFFVEIASGPEKMHGVFADLNQSLAITNDALAVSNARLENEIATLSGKPANNLAVALLEAKEAADKLNESLGKTITAAHKAVEEQSGGWMKRLGAGFMGKADIKDIALELGGETGEGGFRGKIRGLNGEELAKAYQAEVQKFKQQIQNAENSGQYGTSDFLGNVVTGNMAARLEILKGELSELQQSLKEISLTSTNTAKKITVAKGEDKRSAEQLERPFENKMAEIEARIEGSEAKMKAIGGTNQDAVIASGTAQAAKDIEEVIKLMKRKGKEIEDIQRLMIFQRDLDAAAIASDEAWRKKFTDDTDALDERIKQQKILNALDVSSYEAKRDAATESTLKGKYKDEYGSPERAADIAKMRAQLNEEADLEHARALKFESAELATQTTLYTRLAAVAGDFSKTHQAQLDAEVSKMRAEGRYTEDQIRQFERLNVLKLEAANADREAASRLAIQNLQRSGGAAFGGVDVREQAEIQNKLADAEARGIKGAALKTLQAELEEQYREKIIDEAGKLTTQDSDRLTILNKQIAAIQAQWAGQKMNLEAQSALKDLEDQRLDVAIKMTLQQGSALAGVKAFFLEMEKQAEKASQMIYDSLNEVLNKTSDNLAKIMTGNVGKDGIGKMWGETFKGIGDDLTRNAIHSQLQRGLGALGHHFPGLDKVLVGKPDGTANNPLHVIVEGRGAAAGNAVPNPLGGILNRKGGVFGGGDLGGGVFSLVDTEAGGGGERAASGANYYSYTINAPGAQIGAESRIGQAIEAAHNAAVRNSVLVRQQQQVRMPQVTGGGGSSF